MWRALVIPYAAYAAPKEWVVVGTESGVLRVQMAIKSQGDRKPRFSKDCFIAGGRLSLGGQDGRVFGSGTDAYQGELTPGRHSFLLTWRTKDEQFRLSVTRWLECDVSKGHYRLTVKRIGDSISFLALVGARREVVAISPPAQLQKEPIIPDDGEIISVEELQGLL
jgi:hypothetical protein